MANDTFEEVGAFAFKTALSLEEIFAKLSSEHDWQWLERENHYFGPYLSARSDDDCKVLRVFEEEDHHVIDLLIEWDEKDPEREWDALQQHVANEVLPLLSARDIAETEDYW